MLNGSPGRVLLIGVRCHRGRVRVHHVCHSCGRVGGQKSFDRHHAHEVPAVEHRHDGGALESVASQAIDHRRHVITR